MQCQELRFPNLYSLSQKNESKPDKSEKEAIHSGHFMVSHFEAEAQDDEYEVAVPVPEARAVVPNYDVQIFNITKDQRLVAPGQLGIETSLTKLFQCMSLAYRQKLTSPKWNRFKGIRLRWKDKIRLNNVIWRCWHMQFIKRENTLICQFASPLDEGTHNKPEAVVLEGKYWKRKLAAVTAEYKKWRMFYRNRIMGWAVKDSTLTDLDMFDWQAPSNESSQFGAMMVDEDYMELMSDTLFSTITQNQPFAFPDTREIARGASLADFIQPSLVQLQPNLEDFMDTLEPFHEFFPSKLAPVPEDCAVSDLTSPYRAAFPELALEHAQQGAATTEPAPLYTTGKLHDAFASYDTLEEGKIARASTYRQKVRSPEPARQLNKYQAYHKQSASTSHAHAQYSRLPQSYDLAVNAPQTHVHVMPGSPAMLTDAVRSNSLPAVNKDDVFAVPKQHHVVNLKGRHRTHSGSSLVPPKQRTHPPPLLTTNSDPALNISNKTLLPLLLTSSNVSTVYSVTSERSASLPMNKSTNVPILPMPPKVVQVPHTSTLLITTPPLSVGSQSFLSSSRTSASPDSSLEAPSPGSSSSSSTVVQSPSSPLGMFGGPLSPSKSQRLDTPGPYKQVGEHRRTCHINAEQKRRCNIRSGFDMLHSLIPQLQQSTKLSKAALLQKGAEHIRQLQAERQQMKDEMETLRYQIECLNSSISNCQALLPATGAPVSRNRSSKMRDMFDELVRVRTMENWKFWVFSSLFEPFLQSFNCSVSTASYEDLYRSTLIWVEQHCSLRDLRPAVLDALKNLSKTTDILTDPSKLPEEARVAANNGTSLDRS